MYVYIYIYIYIYTYIAIYGSERQQLSYDVTQYDVTLLFAM